eukprot:1551377-Pleurochrysis_carterae.AAC.3
MRRPGWEGLYKSFGCDSRVEFASAHAAQAGGSALRKLCSASEVRLESCFSRAPPQCRRRCM